TLSLYVDGAKVATEKACLADPSTGHTVIGRGEFGGNQVDFLHGSVDDVRVFDRALSDEEVAALAQQPAELQAQQED
ncbi:MAG: LamG-like jellyroll fold domain-containing protein, partial [Geminicoccaceae bacterium]